PTHDDDHARPSCPIFFFHCAGDHPCLPSFPTRRSSDLLCRAMNCGPFTFQWACLVCNSRSMASARRWFKRSITWLRVRTASVFRSEEHTSELQSRGHLVCRLLLEKKKQEWTTAG